MASLLETVTARKVGAIGMFLLMVLAVMLAGIARVAEMPAAGATGKFEGFSPGALGRTRFELARVGSGQIEIDRMTIARALDGAPLASDPFAVLAATTLAKYPKGTTGRETALLLEALKRDPRSRAARILLLRQMAAKGDIEGSFDQLAVLSRLNPALVSSIMDAVTGRISSPRQVDEALAAIEGHDELYQAFVYRMARKPKSREVVLRLSEGLPANVISKQDIRRVIVEQLVGVGEYGAARSLWQKGNASGASGLVHAPDFSDGNALPPFNWYLQVGTTGAAERSRSGGILVTYYDRDPGSLATQLITLSPGKYRVIADFEVLAGSVDNIRLRLVCKGSNAQLAENALYSRTLRKNRLSVEFVVPAFNCPAQVLDVFGAARDMRGESQVRIDRIEVLPEGAVR